VLQQRLAERTQLLSQLEQAKMQETVARSLEGMSELAAPRDTPSLDEVREKIERRYANAMGRAELASNTVEGRMLEVQKSSLDMAGANRLEQIRASMSGGQLTGASNQEAIGSSAASGDNNKNASAAPAANSNSSAGDASVARLDEIRRSVSKDKSGDSSAAG